MTRVKIHSGSCGFNVTVTAEKVSGGKINLAVDTPCEMVKKMCAEIPVLDRFTPLTGFLSNPVYLAASKHLKHVACIVPSGILKAIEVEAGLNVAKDATICFIKD
jgi:hypothetical protein